MVRKPSTRMHEVADISGRFTLIVHCGSQTSCYAFVESQPARRRQALIVRVAKR